MEKEPNDISPTKTPNLPSRDDGVTRWLVWGIEAPARWAARKISVWPILLLLAIFQGVFVIHPVGGYTINLLLAALPLGAAYAAYTLSRGSNAKWWQIGLSSLVAAAVGFGLVVFVGAVSGVIIVVAIVVLTLIVAALFLKIAASGDTNTGVGGATFLTVKPKIGEVYWGEIVNSDGFDAKHRPVIITRVRGDNVRVFYSTSQEKREKQRGYIELTREGWDNGDGKRSFILLRDSRILHISQLGAKIGELATEDRQRLGMDAYHD
jgi:hypothetical protein